MISPWNSKAMQWVKGRRNSIENIRSAVADHKSTGSVWMHCASLGEFEQGRQILETIRTLNPTVCIVLTFFSASGYETQKKYSGADFIFYLPVDSPNNAMQFIDIIKPKLVLWVKYEYWYYYLTQLKKKDIPLLLISGFFRKEQLFFKWYGSLYRKLLPCFTHFFVQTEESKRNLASIGVSKNITVSGDTRFDRVTEIAEQFRPIPHIDSFCRNHKVIVAGSTWQEDEEELDHFANTHPEIKFIIAPHEIDRAHLNEVKKLFRNAIFYTEWESQQRAVTSQQAAPTEKPGRPVPNVLIIDNIGMLSRLYRYATITYVGGGFGEEGVHNVLEAAVYGKPVIFGPIYHKFVEAAELLDHGGAFSISNALDLEKVLRQLLDDAKMCSEAGKSSKEYVYSKRGAKEMIIRYITENKLLE